MRTKSASDNIAALLMLLDRIERRHGELYGVIRDKIDRMRASDVDGMRHCIERESELVNEIAEQEGLRRQLMMLIGQELGVAAHAARAMNLRELARRVAEPRRGELLEMADRLRATVANVAQGNRVAGLIARETLRHFRHVFSAITSADGGRADGYTQGGERHSVSQRQLLDAVG